MMLRHTLTKALEQLRIRVASGDPDLQTARRFVARKERMSEKALVQLDKLLDGMRYDATREQLLQPFEASPPPSQLLEFRTWKDACETARHNMAAPRAGGLGRTAWSDVGGLSRLEVLGLLTLALRTVADTPEVGAGPLFPGLHER